jgi:hypothetical protein
MPPKKPVDPRPAPPVVRYAPLGEVKVYELSEAELGQLENGPPGQIHLNFALALLPAALSLLITLQTVEIGNDRLYAGYLIAFWVFLVQGLISLLRWRSASRNHQSLIQAIRARMPEKPGIPEQVTEVGPPNPPTAPPPG